MTAPPGSWAVAFALAWRGAQAQGCVFHPFLLFRKTDMLLKKGATAYVTLAPVPRRAAQTLWISPLHHQYPGRRGGKPGSWCCSSGGCFDSFRQKQLCLVLLVLRVHKSLRRAHFPSTEAVCHQKSAPEFLPGAKVRASDLTPHLGNPFSDSIWPKENPSALSLNPSP